ncbi:MAG: hypothetical protein OXN89_02340 [Bryobacterales bacterium]|nr:hypothetical protein [Bryobacterales bacterium]
MPFAARIANSWERLKPTLKLYRGDSVRWMVGIGLAVGLGLSISMVLPPLALLPSDRATISRVVGVVLQAQAPTMVISLAVMAIVVGSIQRRRDVDDPLYDWFLDKAWIRPVFVLTVISTLGTGAAFFLVELGIGEPNPNLLLFAGGSILASVGSTVCFALRGLSILRPGRYREYKRAVTIEQVRSASAGYAREVIRSESPDVRQTVWLPREGRAADRALERIIDDAERTIRDGRFVDFRDSMDLLSDCASVAIEEGAPDLEQLSPFVTKARFEDWPIRRPLHHGFYRLRATALRDGREDYANVIHEQCLKWLRTGTFEQHVLLGDLAISLLADEFRITQRFSGSANLTLEWSTQRLIRVAFEHLIEVAVDDQPKASDAARYDISIDLIGYLQGWAGELLDRDDLDSLGVWLEFASHYMGVMSREGAEAHRFGAMVPARRPSSTLTHMRLSVAALAGRALQTGNDAAIELWGSEMNRSAPPAFPADQTASDMSLLKSPSAFAVLEGSWKKWLAADASRRDARFWKPNRYPLFCYLWLAVRDSSFREERPEPRVKSDLRSLYLSNRAMLLARANADEKRRLEIDREILEWVGLTLPTKGASDT